MGNNYVHIEKAPVEYITVDGEIKKIHLIPINKVKISNVFDIPHVRGIVGNFNAMISRFMYFGVFDKYGNERAYPKAQNHIYFPSEQMSNMINKCDSQCRNITKDMKRIFDLDITRSSANRFRLSERVMEFLYVFNHSQLNSFMDKYDITGKDRYRLRQLYNYRVIRPSDGNMSPKQMRDFKSYMKDKRNKDFHHLCKTNHVKYQTRIQEIELHIDLLSDKQKIQLQRIKEFLVEGITDLMYRFHWKLIELQQFVTGMLKKKPILGSDTKQDTETPNSQVNDRNKTEGEQQKTEEVAAAHKKDPEVSLQEVAQVGTFWNIMAAGRDMEIIRSLTNMKIKSIINIVKLIGKDNILQIIENTGHLLINSPIMFDELISNSDRLNKILDRTYPDSRLTDKEIMTSKDKKYKFKMNLSLVSCDHIPQFNSKAEVKSWFKNHLNQM